MKTLCDIPLKAAAFNTLPEFTNLSEKIVLWEILAFLRRETATGSLVMQCYRSFITCLVWRSGRVKYM